MKAAMIMAKWVTELEQSCLEKGARLVIYPELFKAYVREHWRTSKKGTRFHVRGFEREDPAREPEPRSLGAAARKKSPSEKGKKKQEVQKERKKERKKRYAAMAGQGKPTPDEPPIEEILEPQQREEKLEFFDSIWASGRVPDGWVSSQSPPELAEMKNRRLEKALTKALPGTWKKVYHKGFFSHTGETLYIHYHQHLETGKVFNVKPKYGKE